MPVVVLVGAAVVVIGLAMVVLAAISTSRRGGQEEGKRTEVRGGGVIMIGPIPIIFGTDAKWTTVAIALAIILVVVGIVATLGW